MIKLMGEGQVLVMGDFMEVGFDKVLMRYMVYGKDV
jgi:hypothetical protein